MSASEPFIGEIYMFGGNFAPVGWAMCQGQLLSIDQNTALFSLIGTTYGGDGQQTFALPDLRGRIPVHRGNGHQLGSVEGTESVTITVGQMPSHTHRLMASPTASSQAAPAANVAADSTAAGVRMYAVPGAQVNMSAQAIGPAGGSQPHENRMPFVAMNFIIALEGIFPSRN